MRAAMDSVKIFLRAENRLGAGLKSAEGSLASFRAKANKELAKVGKAGVAAITAIGIAAGTIGASFEQGLANVQSVARATDKEMALLERTARSLGSSTKFSAREATDAMYSLASSGQKTAEIIASTEGVLKLAGATMTDMGSSAELVVSTLAQFGLKANQTNAVANVFAAGIQNSQLNMERLAYSMQYAAPMSAALGMKLEETVAALGLLHNAGLKGRIAGTGLRAAFVQLLDPADSLKKVLGGTTVETAGLAAVLDKLAAANLSAAQMTEMFGAEGFNAIRALTVAGVDGFNEMLASVDDTNAAFEMYDKQMDTTASRTKILKSAAEDAAIGIFRAMQTNLDKAIVGATEFVNSAKGQFAFLFKAITDYIVAAWPVIEAFGRGFGAALAWVLTVARPTLAVIATLFQWMSSHTETVETMAKGLGILAASTYGVSLAVGAWSKAQAGLNTLMKANPVGAIVTALSVLITALVLVVDKLGGWRATWAYVVAGFKIGVAWIAGAFREIAIMIDSPIAGIRAFGIVVTDVLNRALLVIKSFAQAAGTILLSLGKMLINPFKAKETWAEMKEALSANMSGLGADMAAIGEWSAGKLEAGHEAALAKIRENTAASIAGIKTDLASTLEEVTVEPAALPVVPTLTVPGGGEIDPAALADQIGLPEIEIPVGGLADGVLAETERAYVILEEFNAGMQDVFLSGWDSIIDGSKTGSQKWSAIWKNIKTTTWQITGDVVKRWLWGQKTQLVATQTTEAGMTAAKNSGVAARLIAGAREAAGALKTGVVNIWHAVTGFYKAHAGIPFVGAAIAAAAVVGMYKMLGAAKRAVFHDGGWGDNRPTRSWREVDATILRDEIVMNPGASKRFGPLLEMMNAGVNPFAGGGASSPGPAVAASAGTTQGDGPAAGRKVYEITLKLDEGQVVFADDRLGLYRMAEAIKKYLDEIDAGVLDTRRLRSAGG